MSVVLETAYVLVAEGAQGQRYFAGPTAIVREVNDGNQTVPTVLFPDGSAVTNPSIQQVKERLGA